VAAQIDGLGLGDGGDGAGRDGALAGGSPAASENRAIRGAQAALARDNARVTRAQLAGLRDRAERMADRVRRERRAHTVRVAASADTGAEQGRRRVIATLARDLAHAQDVDTVQQLLVRGLADALPGTSLVGMCRPVGVDGAGSVALVAGDAAIAELVAAEDATEGGPFGPALSDGSETVHVPDLGAATEWPGLAEQARRMGIRSVLVHRLSERHDECAGVLVAATGSADGFDHRARATMEAVADMAGIAVSGARRIEQLVRAVESRDLIGQAKGILMLRDGCGDEQAFSRLVAASQHANMKLVDVAAWLVADHATPGPTDGAP
jgi:hypothetical protein